MISVFLAAAVAGEWKDPRPFVAPIVNFGVVRSGGQTFGQASAGAVGGVNIRYNEAPHWVSTTRAQLVGTYGIPSGSLGADVRVGSFIGPDFKLLKIQAGPDVFYNGYGNTDAVDYFLPWTAGVDLRALATVKIAPPVKLIGEAAPGWVFNPERASDQVEPFDQLSLLAYLSIDGGPLRFNLGFSRQYTAAGTIDGLILSGGF